MPATIANRPLTNGLCWSEGTDRSTALVDGPCGPRPVIELLWETSRTRTLLMMPVGGRGFDVTVQPGAIDEVVEAEALATRLDPNGWRGALEAATRSSAALHGQWRRGAQAPRGLIALLGGLGFPMLAGAYDRGAAPISTVPRWAAFVLAQPTARAASGAAFAQRATRRNARALAQSLLPPPGAPEHATVALGPLCLALVGRSTLEPDALAEVLSAPGPWHATPTWLSPAEVSAAEALLTLLGPSAGTRLLLDAATAPLGIERLFETLDLFRQVRHQVGRVPRCDLDELRRLCLSLQPPNVPVLTPEAGHQAAPTAAHPPAPRPGRARRGHAAHARAPDVPLAAPTTAPAPLPAVYRHPDPLRAIDLATDRDIRLVLPHSPAELVRWGERLHNCLATYATAIAAGASWIVGVEHRGDLVACVEINPASRQVRQLLAAHNRPPPPPIVDATLRILRSRRVIGAGVRV